LFEALTLVQTGKITKFPIVLVDSSYWSGLLSWIRDTVIAQGNVSPADLDLLSIADDPDDVVRIIKAAHSNGGPPGGAAGSSAVPPALPQGAGRRARGAPGDPGAPGPRARQ